MLNFSTEAKKYSNPEDLATAFLGRYYEEKPIEYPINPFRMLKEQGILFVIAQLNNLEGCYIPADGQEDIPLVGINVNRPITRQRFTAAHELCHHFRDCCEQINCFSGSEQKRERFAEKFAAALLMPLRELRNQVNKRKKGNYVSFSDVLEIADYFGVSFQACLFRIAYIVHAIDGDTEPEALKKRANSFGPDKKRKNLNMSYRQLYEGLIDCYKDQLSFKPTEYAKRLFQNRYIYSDSRMEGLSVTREQASEIVNDLRLNKTDSQYSEQFSEVYMSIAGHYDMYQSIFDMTKSDSFDLFFPLFTLHKKLFSYYPYASFGGATRTTNTLVLGAKFETVDYNSIMPELAKLDTEVKSLFAERRNIAMIDYIKQVARIHHRITVIHPFPEGNGRTSRAFMNAQLIVAGITPLYVTIEDKKEYVDALSKADRENFYDDLYELLYRLIIRCSAELNCDYGIV